MQGSLKGRLSRTVFHLKCMEYQNWLVTHLQFSNKWINDWMGEYRVSLSKPNKRFSLSQHERVIRIVGLLKNVWRVKRYFNVKFGTDPIIINRDQMPPHRNKSAGEKTMPLTGEQVYVVGTHNSLHTSY